MTLNTIQQNALTHLGTGSHDRQRALNSLIGRGFFTVGDTEDQSKEKALAYTTENPDGFCGDGIGRFLGAIGAEGGTDPRVASVDVFGTVQIHFTEDVAEARPAEINAVFRAINNALQRMIRGSNWSIDASGLDWEFSEED